MKTRLTLTIISLLTLSLFSCESNDLQKREDALRQKEQEHRRKEAELENKQSQTSEVDTSMNRLYETPASAKKYLYVVIRTIEPKIISEMVEDKSTTTDNSTPDPSPYTDAYLPREVKPVFIQAPHYIVYSKPQYLTYTSDIIEVDNYIEDSKFIEQDRYEKTVQRAIDNANMRLEFEKNKSDKPIDNAVAKIISRACYVFNTYSEASGHRAQNKNISEQ